MGCIKTFQHIYSLTAHWVCSFRSAAASSSCFQYCWLVQTANLQKWACYAKKLIHISFCKEFNSNACSAAPHGSYSSQVLSEQWPTGCNISAGHWFFWKINQQLGGYRKDSKDFFSVFSKIACLIHTYDTRIWEQALPLSGFRTLKLGIVESFMNIGVKRYIIQWKGIIILKV